MESSEAGSQISEGSTVAVVSSSSGASEGTKKKRKRKKNVPSAPQVLVAPAITDENCLLRAAHSNFPMALGMFDNPFHLPMINSTYLQSRALMEQDLWRQNPIFRKELVDSLGQAVRKITLGNPNNRNSKANNKIEEVFEEYISEEDAINGIKSGILIEGAVRINPKNFKEAYISDPDDGQDIAILGVAERNRALEGDMVAIKIKEPKDWNKQENGKVQRTAKVVRILEMIHPRICVGFMKNIEKNYALLSPRDHRVPRLQIPRTTIALKILQNPEMFKNTLFSAEIMTWSHPKMAQGLIKDEIGEKNNLEVETNAILIERNLDTGPIDPKLNRYLPKIPYTIPQDEINKRMDLRAHCIFSIDPETARDLDDAVSIRQVGKDLFEVGVHISDVSYYLNIGTPLDEAVGQRATTTYLVNRVIHMLPIELCMLCSLLPGEDKLAMTVLWRMDSEGNIKGQPLFTRSIINSCSQLSYDHAQAIIEGKPVELPTLFNNFTEDDIKDSILRLNKIAKKLKEERGSMRLDMPKCTFKLNSSCDPIDAKVYKLQDSNRLIEEMMLLANIAVAQLISQKIPEIALLRRHEYPKKLMIDKLQASLQKLGIFLNFDAPNEFKETMDVASQGSLSRYTVLNWLALRSMRRAEYYCNCKNSGHYALNVEMYTHFTSPIRRYADILVHRALCTVLGYIERPSYSTLRVKTWASNCNIKKLASRRAFEMSCELFASILVKNVGSYRTKAFVCGVFSYSFEAIVLDLALSVKVYLQDFEGTLEFSDNGLSSYLVVKWNHYPGQLIQLFSEVTLELTVHGEFNQIRGELLPIVPEIV